ncbi:MAG TPA: hypothetical protein VIL42_02090 [Sphingomicrobium sp.]
MDDWEKHFVEKSRRRADKERAERRRKRQNARIALVMIVLVLIGSVAALVFLR